MLSLLVKTGLESKFIFRTRSSCVNHHRLRTAFDWLDVGPVSVCLECCLGREVAWHQRGRRTRYI